MCGENKKGCCQDTKEVKSGCCHNQPQEAYVDCCKDKDKDKDSKGGCCGGHGH